MNILTRLLSQIKPDSIFLMSIETAQKIVRDYANFTASSTPLPGCVADTLRLPHPKAKVKTAITICLKSSDNANVRKELGYGYLMLSAWQEGVGGQTVGLDFTGINLEDDPLVIANNIQRHSEKISHWKPIIDAEQAILKSKLKALEEST